MRRIPSITIYKKALGLAAAGLFMFAAVLVVGGPTSGHANAAAKKAAAPKCAIIGQGRVNCPDVKPGSGSVQNGKCYYKDPGNPKGPTQGATKDGWSTLGCDSDAFKTAAAPQGCVNNTKAICQDPALKCADAHCDLVKQYIDPLITALAATVGVVVTISIVVGGIQYASAGGEPQKAAQAKGRITNALYALLAFFLLFAALEWLLPGGLLH